MYWIGHAHAATRRLQKLGWRFIGPAITQAESDDEIYHIFAHLFFLGSYETSSCVQRANRLYIRDNYVDCFHIPGYKSPIFLRISLRTRRLLTTITVEKCSSDSLSTPPNFWMLSSSHAAPNTYNKFRSENKSNFFFFFNETRLLF